jgi:hypothetical protein
MSSHFAGAIQHKFNLLPEADHSAEWPWSIGAFVLVEGTPGPRATIASRNCPTGQLRAAVKLSNILKK